MVVQGAMDIAVQDPQLEVEVRIAELVEVLPADISLQRDQFLEVAVTADRDQVLLEAVVTADLVLVPQEVVAIDLLLAEVQEAMEEVLEDQEVIVEVLEEALEVREEAVLQVVVLREEEAAVEETNSI